MMEQDNGMDGGRRRGWRERLGRLLAAGLLAVWLVSGLVRWDGSAGNAILFAIVLGLLIAGLVADFTPAVWVTVAFVCVVLLYGLFEYSGPDGPYRVWIAMFAAGFLVLLIGSPSVLRASLGIGLVVAATLWAWTYSEPEREDAGLGVHCAGRDAAELDEDPGLVDALVVVEATDAQVRIEDLLASGVVVRDEVPRDESPARLLPAEFRPDPMSAANLEQVVEIEQIFEPAEVRDSVLVSDVEACESLDVDDFSRR